MVYGPDGRGLAPAHKGAKVRRPPGPARCPCPRAGVPEPCLPVLVIAVVGGPELPAGGCCGRRGPGPCSGGSPQAPWGAPCSGSPSPGRQPPDRPMGGSGRAVGPRPLGGHWPAGAPKPPGLLGVDPRPGENMAAPPASCPRSGPGAPSAAAPSIPGASASGAARTASRGAWGPRADGGDLWPPNGASGLCSGRARPPRTPGEYTRVSCPDGTLPSRLAAERPGARPSCTFKAGAGVGGGRRGRLCPPPARSPLPRARMDGPGTRERSASLDGR